MSERATYTLHRTGNGLLQNIHNHVYKVLVQEILQAFLSFQQLWNWLYMGKAYPKWEQHFCVNAFLLLPEEQLVWASRLSDSPMAVEYWLFIGVEHATCREANFVQQRLCPWLCFELQGTVTMCCAAKSQGKLFVTSKWMEEAIFKGGIIREIPPDHTSAIPTAFLSKRTLK